MLHCAGKSARDEAKVGAAAGMGPTAGGGASQGGAASDPDFAPDNPDVPAQGDGRLRGSFEGNQGDGWDTCFSSLPGLSPNQPGASAASDGARYLTFDSSVEAGPSCTSSTCSDAQVAFWLDAPISAGEALSLYFDVINLKSTDPSGILHIDGTDSSCVTTEKLATIPLGALDISSSWQTRCLTFTTQTDLSVFGIYVDRGDFHIGVDAFRFGPACHAD